MKYKECLWVWDKNKSLNTTCHRNLPSIAAGGVNEGQPCARCGRPIKFYAAHYIRFADDDKTYEYAGHTFKPFDLFDKRKFKTLKNLNLVNHTELKLWDDNFAKAFNEKPVHIWNYNEFYNAMNNNVADIFLCDNNKLYVPCEHELMEFRGYN